MTDPSPVVSVRNIRKSFGGHEVLRGIDLTVHRGELVSLIGPSGCGKSTLLRCLNLLEPMDSGTLEIAGITMTREGKGSHLTAPERRKAHDIRQHVGMVFQSFHLFPHLTLLENICLAPTVVKGANAEQIRSEALVLLEKVGLRGFDSRMPSQLSGGQQQRGAIARALAMNPAVLLYDEPTSALDPRMVDEVLDVMRSLDQDGMTQIVVTHEMRFAREASDMIGFLENGELVEYADEDEIFENPKDPRTQNFLKRFRSSGGAL